MIKIILFIAFLPFALFEVFFYKQFGLIVVGTLYIVLVMQAERSAKTFLRDGLGWRFPTRQSRLRARGSEQEDEDSVPVQPLGERLRAKDPYTPMRNDAPVVEEKPIETVRLSRPSPFRLNPDRTAVPPPASQMQMHSSGRVPEDATRTPNYRGLAHEVLAIPENSATRTIKRAFRFWVKKVHPDQNGGKGNELLHRRVQKITEAKELLLLRRRGKKAA